MNNKQRKEWVIRYAKNHNMTNILNNKYLNKKEGWISKNSNSIQSICSLVSVLFIGVLSLIISYQQTDLSNKNNLLYEKEISPHFRTTELYIKNVDEYHWEEVIQIKNHGGNYYMFKSDVFSFIIFKQAGKTYAIPMQDYYIFSSKENSDLDNIVIEHFTDFRLKIYDLIVEANKSLGNKDDGDTAGYYLNGVYDEVVSYVRINYQNSFGDEKTQYFEARNSRLIDNDTGDRYHNLCSLKYHNGNGISFNASGMNLELMLEFANTDLKEQYAIDVE